MNDVVNLRHRLQRQLGEFRAELETMKIKVRRRFKSSGDLSVGKQKSTAETIAALDEKLMAASRTLANVEERNWAKKRGEVLRLWEELRDEFFAARTRLFPTQN